MSIDIQFDAFQALKADATLLEETAYPHGHLIKIPGYPHTRDCSVLLNDGQPHQIHLSCGGASNFYKFFLVWLQVNEIDYEVY